MFACFFSLSLFSLSLSLSRTHTHRYVQFSEQYNFVRSQKLIALGIDPNNAEDYTPPVKMSFMAMCKKAKADAMDAMDGDLGIMGKGTKICTKEEKRTSILILFEW